MDKTLAEINRVAERLHLLWGQRGSRRQSRDRRDEARELKKQLEALWYRRRMELAGEITAMFDVPDILRRPHMIDYVERLSINRSAGSRQPLYDDLVKVFNQGVAVQLALPWSA